MKTNYIINGQYEGLRRLREAESDKHEFNENMIHPLSFGSRGRGKIVGESKENWVYSWKSDLLL